MAIINKIESTPIGIGFDSAYHRIASSSISRTANNPESKFIVTLDVAVYAIQPTDDNTHPVSMIRLHADLNEIEAFVWDKFLDKCYSFISSQVWFENSSAI